MNQLKRRVSNIAAGVLSGALFAVAVFLLLELFFKATMPDCAPGQIDGQCGLATFLQEMYSLAGALLAWLIAAILFSIYFLRRSVRSAAQGEGR